MFIHLYSLLASRLVKVDLAMVEMWTAQQSQGSALEGRRANDSEAICINFSIFIAMHIHGPEARGDAKLRHRALNLAPE